jgi:hypothetical protein
MLTSLQHNYSKSTSTFFAVCGSHEKGKMPCLLGIYFPEKAGQKIFHYHVANDERYRTVMTTLLTMQKFVTGATPEGNSPDKMRK